VTTELKADLGAAVAQHAPGELQRMPDGRTSFLCRCDMRFAGETIETARRIWGDHVVGVVIMAGGFNHHPYLERAARDFHHIMRTPPNPLDPYGYAWRKQLVTLDQQLVPILEHIDRERGT
jgi:hypothetical protein